MDKELSDVSRTEQACDEQGERFAARRRVIKGALGVPAVVTLACGSTAAAASMFQCIVKVQEDTALPTDGGTEFIDFDDATNCPSPDEFAPNVFDCGQDTAVRDRTVDAVEEGQEQPPNLVLVDQNGDFNTGDAQPIVQSCYTSIITVAAETQNDTNVVSRFLQRLGGQR